MPKHVFHSNKRHPILTSDKFPCMCTSNSHIPCGPPKGLTINHLGGVVQNAKKNRSEGRRKKNGLEGHRKKKFHSRKSTSSPPPDD